MTDTCAACGGIDRVTGILRCACGVEVCSECRARNHQWCNLDDDRLARLFDEASRRTAAYVVKLREQARRPSAEFMRREFTI